MPTSVGYVDEDIGAPISRLKQRKRKAWTALERIQLRTMLEEEGLFIADAAEFLNRSYRAVYDMAMKRGFKFTRDLPSKNRPRRKPEAH